MNCQDDGSGEITTGGGRPSRVTSEKIDGDDDDYDETTEEMTTDLTTIDDENDDQSNRTTIDPIIENCEKIKKKMGEIIS